MDTLNAVALKSARFLSQRQEALSAAILAVSDNPTVDSIAAMNQAQILFSLSLGVMKRIESSQSEEGAQLLQMMGLGQSINTFA